MTFPYRSLLLVTLCLLLSNASFGQTTSTLAGSVMTEGAPLPGVTVTVSSPVLIGGRSTTTGPNGDYALAALPPGAYSISFELEGMQSLTRQADLKLAETGRVDADLKVSTVEESITVTGTAPSVLETPQISTNLDAKLIEELAIGRRIQDRIQLAPGVVNSGTNGQTVIHGAQSFDNLYLVNGVVINENVRGQPQNAVIEDAIQETTLLTGGVSAEFGRFTGGVVSTITKSGGNEFTGSLRDNITNDDWTEKTDFRDPVTGVPQREPLDKINPIYEATLGGRIIRDRLWFFGAGRGEKSSLSNQTSGTNIPYITTRDQKRYEGKLTGQITNNHTLVGSYLDVDDPQANTSFGSIVDLRSLRTVTNTIKLLSGHYSGVLTRNVFVEGQYSRKDSTIIGGGSQFRDVIFGTMIRDISGSGRRGWSPTFCGVCRDKERDNEDYLAKLTYFLSTRRTGSHNIVGGYDEFHELRTEDNFQSGSDFRLFGTFLYVGQEVFLHLDPSLNNAGVSRSRIQWDPLLGASQTSDFTTRSYFVNDKWDLNDRWSFNVGVRFDSSDGQNQAGVKTVDDSRLSPRLGAVYDVKADGRLRLSAEYGRYAAKIDQGPADSTATAGRYATYLFQYRGPEINRPGTPASQLVPTEEVIRRAFAWFQSQGGATTTSPLIFSALVPGLSQKIVDPLASPYMDEISFGIGSRIGSNGFLRADLIHRNWSDFYVVRKDLTTGKTAGGLDIGLIENGGDDFDRTYDAFQVQGDYRFLGRFRFGGNYTYSKLRGNVEGEEFNNATVPVGIIQPGGSEVFETPHFPEYTDFDQNRPTGHLSADMRHRGNLWVQFDTPVPFGALSLSVLERYHSGQPYSAIGAVNPQRSALLPGGIENPGYARPPSAVNYYFSERGEFRLDDISETDINGTYQFPIKRVTLFVKADLINVFNEQGVEFVENPNSTAGSVIERRVRTRVNGTTFPSGRPAAAFNPFTEQPVEGVHYELDPNFGKPTNKDAYQLPRTYRVAVGVRF